MSTEPLALRSIVAAGALEDDPFVLIDVGCALGIDPAWRMFGTDFIAHGLDPQVDECTRLNDAESNPNITYHATFVGLPADHPFHTHALCSDEPAVRYFDSFARTSAGRAADRHPRIAHESPDAVEATDNWKAQKLALEKTTISEFVLRKGIRSVDFVKIDTDGSDLEAAMSCEEAFRPAEILGLLIESPFWGTHHATDNTFHNIDRYMKEQGFLLFGITVNRYSRAVLPQTFVYRAPYQTRLGQPMWGDMLYLRDAGSADYEAAWGSPLTVTKLLKLVCLFELFELPDCAAEVVLANRSRLATAVDPDALLDLLTPPLRGEPLRYGDYNTAFDDDIELFYPVEEPPPDGPKAATVPPGRRRFTQSVLHRFRPRRLPR